MAAIFVEPIQGEGGYFVPPPGFLPALRDLCDRTASCWWPTRCRSGMGRTGKMFAVEHWNVAPDIICTAKGIASGMPLGAIIAQAEIMDWPPGSHASTFGGNPVSCRAALATIELLQSEYMANATLRGEQLRQGLLQLQKEFLELGDVRGLGLMMAVDVVKDRDKQILDPALRDRDRAGGIPAMACCCWAAAKAPSASARRCASGRTQVDTALSILGKVLTEMRGAVKKTG